MPSRERRRLLSNRRPSSTFSSVRGIVLRDRHVEVQSQRNHQCRRDKPGNHVFTMPDARQPPAPVLSWFGQARVTGAGVLQRRDVGSLGRPSARAPAARRRRAACRRVQRRCLHPHIETNPLRRAPAGGHRHNDESPLAKSSNRPSGDQDNAWRIAPVPPSGAVGRKTSRDGPPPAGITSTKPPISVGGQLHAVRRDGKRHHFRPPGNATVFSSATWRLSISNRISFCPSSTLTRRRSSCRLEKDRTS